MKTKLLLVTAVACFYFATASLAQTVPSYVPTNGLVGWWPFNGNANDESGNGNNGTVNGATLAMDRFGNLNQAYHFDGNNDINIIEPTNNILDIGNNTYTFSIWFKNDSSNGVLALLHKRRMGGTSGLRNFEGYTVWIENDTLFAEIEDLDTLYSRVFIPNIGSAEWRNVVFIRDVTSDVLKIFLDGSLVSIVTDNSISTTENNVNLLIGKWRNYSGYSFIGKLDDIGIWNRALTQQEITALYQSNNCSVPSYVPTNGLVGYWPFCGNANDVSGNGNNGTVNGATLTTDRNGNANEAYSFDGNGDYIGASANSLPSSDRTISVWFNPTSMNGGPGVLGYGGNSCGNSFLILINQPLTQDKIINQGHCLADTLTTGFSQNTNNVWQHLVITIDPTGTKHYLNGVQTASNSSYIINTFVQNKDFSIGSIVSPNGIMPFVDSNSNWWNGKLDDIGIWNRALTQQEISNLYTSGCTKPEPVSLGTSASTRLCPNESVTIEIVSPPDSANYNYQWTRNGTNMVGATTRSITVNDAAKYKVFVSSGPGVDCRRVSGLVETTPSIPPSVVATAPNGTSYCPGDSVLMTATGATAGYSYRWKRFGVVIPGANSNTFYATQTGNYRCEIFNAGGCITQSNLISINNGTSCRIMEQTNSDVSVYPNPAQNAFTVSFNDIGNETPVSVSLRSLQGQVIEQRNIAGKEDVQFAVNKLSPGLYVVIIQLDSGDSIEKTVVVE